MPNHEKRSFRRRLGLLLVLLSTAGCYTFTPVTSVESGREIRARLNVEAAVRRSQSTGEPIRHVDGRVIEYGPESLSLDVLVARSTSVFQDLVIRDTVTLMTSEIESILERRLSVGRTILLTAAVAGGAVAVVSGISTIVGGNDEPPDNGDPAIVVPLFSIGNLRSIYLLGLTLRR